MQRQLVSFSVSKITSASQLAFLQWHAPCTSTIVPTSRPAERIGRVSSVGSLGLVLRPLASPAVVHAASLSAAAFKSGDRLSCCATPIATVPLRKATITKMMDFMGPEMSPYIDAGY